ncbi:MAG: thiol-disulfide oxidoreductase DCC family protein [Jeotgalicoccus sp.]
MKVLIFDGECNFCSFFVRFTVDINENPELRITDFTTEWTKENYTPDNDIDSVIYIVDGRTYIHSDAVLHMLADANKLFKPFILFKLIPKFIRDSIYKLIAKHRKNIPVKNICERPNQKFLDMYLS